MESKREITPHKGGRDANLSIRLTKEEKNILKTNAESKGDSIPDYIMECVRYYEEQKSLKTN